MLIEKDHREDKVTLALNGELFSVPRNVYIIGMMNTADRGLALIDYSLRRRFAFFEMKPALENPAFRAAVEESGGKRLVALGDAYLQHNTQIADGLSGLGAALAAMAEQGVSMVYDTVHMVLAQGDMVLGVSEGTFGGAPTSYYDLWRVEDGKIAEHWDVMETIAERDTWANENGKF